MDNENVVAFMVTRWAGYAGEDGPRAVLFFENQEALAKYVYQDWMMATGLEADGYISLYAMPWMQGMIQGDESKLEWQRAVIETYCPKSDEMDAKYRVEKPDWQ